MSDHRLIYWRFFEKLEEELGYKPSITKYEIFCTALSRGDIPYEEDYSSFMDFCKILLLQYHKDEERFEQLVQEAIPEEVSFYLKDILQKTKDKSDAEVSSTKPQEQDSAKEASTIIKEEDKVAKPPEPKKAKKKKQGKEEVTKYFHPQYDLTQDNLGYGKTLDAKSEKYILSNEYLPFSKRQMEKSWQYYRRKQTEGFTDNIDFPATIKEIAKEGFFMNPVYSADRKNTKDTLIILADFKGSMVPFHELNRELIRTAKEGGGHSEVAVYFFRNVPSRSVFRYANLTQPIRLEQVFAQCNTSFTKAIIISDAGASRIPGTQNVVAKRVEATRRFIKLLNTAVSKAIWVNPMPQHRWKDTAAQEISNFVDMVPVLEEDKRLFLNTFKAFA